MRTYEVAAINLEMDNMNNNAVHIAAMKGREDIFKVLAITTLAHAANKHEWVSVLALFVRLYATTMSATMHNKLAKKQY